MSNIIQKCFFHVDLDAFFASVEQVVHPEYKGKPVIISGDPHKRRNVVSTASYEARKFGVHSAMPSYKAYELCPHGIFVDHHMDLYFQYSEKVMAILHDFSPDVLQLSIDEACLDMTGTEKLFGPPEEAARKIKETVKEQTGLTISIGIASNSYLAKICSDINKPDGLFRIMPGQEENFMLTLPINKIWGVGQKTQTRLISCGLKTVKDIKSHSLEFLKTIFGQAGSNFLYNVCRGREPEGYRAKPKSKSLSNETTFEYDLTDRNTIEVSLMNLCVQVMARLLKHNLTSLTVQLKIRYEDFTTVNIQQTFETPVICSDELYERVLCLFDKKFNGENGIRLLGVGVSNVVPVSQIIQPELFENKNLKKQTLEKAIIQLETKNPKIKISKARLISKTKLIFLLSSILIIFSNKNIFSQNINDTTRPDTNKTEVTNAGTILDESKLPPKLKLTNTSLFNYTTDSTNIEFIADGFWNTKLLHTTNMTFGYGKPFDVSFGMPVFEQEVDLSLWFLLNNCFYVQGAFADKFNKNTLAIGYYSDGIIKDIKASNRNIVFPETYSLSDLGRSIGGGDNQAPGISANLQSDKWKFDAAFRYDMLSQCDKMYYGTNAVTDVKINKSNFIYGTIFILPSSQVTRQVTGIYVESSQGTFTDEAGRQFKKLSTNDYLILAGQNSIILSQDVAAVKRNGIKSCVLIEFDDNAASLKMELGTYGTPEIPELGSGYLKDIQDFFGSNLRDLYGTEKSKNQIPQVSKYSYGKKVNSISMPDSTGTQTDGYFVMLNSKTMLLAQNSTGFSPFVAAYRYDGGTAAIQDVKVASYSTETPSKTYDAVIADTIDAVNVDFFRTKRTYVDVYNPDYTLASENKKGNKISWSSPEVNFPFADTSPGTYLGFESSNDECIMLRSFTPTSRIDIGTKAVSGTVFVYKNGVLDSSAKYNPQSGEVSLSSGISSSDKIYITWYEDTENSKTGMVTGALGFNYDFLETLSGDVALSTRWTLNPDNNYAEYKRTAGGYTTLSTKLKWQEENIAISNTAGLTLQVDNITGNYKISGMDSNIPTTAYLTNDAAIDLPLNFTPLLNIRDKNPIELEKKYNCSVEHQSGQTDSHISGYKIPVSWNFNLANNSVSQNATADITSANDVLWAATTIRTNANKNILANASRFNLAIKLPENIFLLPQNSDTDFKIYLQLGVSGEKDFTYENKGSIPTWIIYDTSLSQEYKDVITPIKNTLNWQTISVALKDTDRAMFAENCNIRIIVTAKKKSAQITSGSIYVGPYEAITQGVYTFQDKNFTVSSYESKQHNPDVKKFNKDQNYSENIFWEVADSDATKLQDSKITLYKYFNEVDIASYKTINLYFAYTAGGNKKNIDSLPFICDNFPLTILLDRESKDAASDGQKSIEVQIPYSSIKPYINFEDAPIGTPSKLHHLQINRITQKVLIDGKTIQDANVYVNANVVPTRLKIKVDSVLQTNNDKTSYLYTKGRFTLDELYLSEISPKVIVQDQIKTSFKKDGEILSINNFSLLQDASIKANGDFTGTMHTDKDFQNKYGFSGNADANVTLATIKISNQIGRAAESKHNITSAGHSICTTTPILKFLSFEETYVHNKDDKKVSKQNSFSLNFSQYNFPLFLKGSTEISSDDWSMNQKINDTFNFSIGTKYKYSLNVVANASQKISSNKTKTEKISTTNYFDSWADSTKFEFSTGSSNASKRTISGSINNTFTHPFAGFAPQINLSENGTYTSSTQNLFSDTTDFQTIFPFKLANQNFSVSYSKSSSLIQNISKGGDYTTDINAMCKSMQKKDWYFTSWAFYDLFSDELSSKVLKTLPNAQKQSSLLASDQIAQSANYNGKYELNWKRPIYANHYDLLIPTIATFSFARDISTAENIADTYQLKGSLGYTAINIFSNTSNFAIIPWCISDEYNFSFQVTLRMPKSNAQNIKQIYTTYLQANFYKTQEDVLRTALQFTIQDKKNFNAKTTILYKRQSSFSPILELIKLFKKTYDYSDIKITRTDSFNASFFSSLADSTNAKQRVYQSYEYSHNADFQIIKQFAITSGVTGMFTHTKDEICKASFTLELGGKLTF